MTAGRARRLAWGGVVGPVGFTGAWLLGGLRTDGYSPVNDAISRLAAVHAPTRPLMTGGFVLFGAGVPLFSVALRAIGGRAWMAACATGVCTLAVAAFPLDAGVDGLHAASAVAGYATLAATPILAAATLGDRGDGSLTRASRLLGMTSAALLAASLLGPAHGAFQRSGVAVADVWIVAAALAIVSGRSDLFGASGRSTGHTTDDAGRGIHG